MVKLFRLHLLNLLLHTTLIRTRVPAHTDQSITIFLLLKAIVRSLSFTSDRIARPDNATNFVFRLFLLLCLQKLAGFEMLCFILVQASGRGAPMDIGVAAGVLARADTVLRGV